MSMARKDDVVAWECSKCGVPIMPEELFEHAMTSVSGKDVVAVGHCECGNSALLTWTIAAWNRLHRKRKAQLDRRQDIDKQRRASEIGREVAAFRRQLETMDTLEDMGLTT